MRKGRLWWIMASASAISLGASTAQAATPAPLAIGAPVIKVCVDVVPKTWAQAPAGDDSAAAGTARPDKSVADGTRGGHSSAPGAAAASKDDASWFVQQNRNDAASAGVNARRHWGKSTPRMARSGSAPDYDPSAEDHPEQHLKRLLEYEVTHDEAYEAVPRGCEARMTVELYELRDGWTVFGRFSRYAREEKVDHVRSDEFAALAERMARALLHDKPIDETITRNNVLRDDSETATRSIHGSSYAEFGLGTAARVGLLPTAPENGTAPATNTWRIITPVAISGGYREKVRNWALEAFGRLYFGTSERAVSHDPAGGHADYSWGFGGGLHFIGYADPAGMNSVYYGGGATFELQRFTLIRPEAQRTAVLRDEVWTGGLDLDLVAGYEFMRASSLHFYTQLDVNFPTYIMQNESASGKIETYLPGALAQIGLLF